MLVEYQNSAPKERSSVWVAMNAAIRGTPDLPARCFPPSSHDVEVGL